MVTYEMGACPLQLCEVLSRASTPSSGILREHSGLIMNIIVLLAQLLGSDEAFQGHFVKST